MFLANSLSFIFRDEHKEMERKYRPTGVRFDSPV